MWLSQLGLVNYRNFRSLRLEPQPGVLLFCGRNGQGKTNLLESVYVLATTRSPRTNVDRELLSWQSPDDTDLAAVVAPYARLEARVRRLEGEVHLELSLEGERPALEGSPSTSLSRAIKVNGLPVRATGLVGQLPVVYFSPADVELAGGPPAGRRQYLNVANSQASPSHLRALQRYNRVLLQRNQVLRLVRERRQPATALEPWTEQMFDWGALVLRQRVCMLRQVDERVASIFRDLAGTTETLRIFYRSTACELLADSLPEPADLALGFRERQARVASREIDQAVSLIGPHRDDFTFVLDGVDLNTYGSRGQQRLAVLALKLAEADWMRAEIGELPVVLLDDVLSELDPQRRGYVLQRVAEPEPTHQRQVWITTTDSTFAQSEGQTRDFLSSAQRYEIDAGRLRTA
ncbi:MAG: DNA replication/repair protein RecF [Chloroflexota bacterium]|nr:DNA replication/repair protein RecF [Chloroflexota bacterium]